MAKNTNFDKSNLATPVMVILLVICFIVLCNPIAIVGVGERLSLIHI